MRCHESFAAVVGQVVVRDEQGSGSRRIISPIHVGTGATVEPIEAVPATQHVVPVAADQGVITVTSIQSRCGHTSADGVVSAQSIDHDLGDELGVSR